MRTAEVGCHGAIPPPCITYNLRYDLTLMSKFVPIGCSSLA